MKNKFDDNRWMDENFEDNQWDEKDWEKEDMEDDFNDYGNDIDEEFENEEFEDEDWEAESNRPCHEDDRWEEDFRNERSSRERCREERPCRKPCREECSERKCSGSCEDQCRFTMEEILRRIARHGCGTPVTVYLNVPGELDMHNNCVRTNLQVANNASVLGSTAPRAVTIAGTTNIPAGAIEISSTGTVDIPGLDINPADARTVDGIFMPISISSEGSVVVDFSEGAAAGTIAPLQVRGTAAGQTITVPISAFGTASFNAGGVDFVDIPALEICCAPCSGGTTENNNSICGCVNFHTQPVRVRTKGRPRNVEIPITVTGESTARVNASPVTATTVQSTVSLGLSGQVTAPVTVQSEAGASSLVPRLGVQGRTAGAPGVALASAGGNTSPISARTNVSGTIESLSVSGTAATRGLPVTGTVEVNTDVRHAFVRFTGTVEAVDGNSVTLRERGTNRKVVLSLCDIIKITFASFRGMRCMSRVFEGHRLDRCSCVYGIQKNLSSDACKSGSIELFASGTFNPIAEAIKTDDIRIVDGGILWISEKHGCRPAEHTVYSLCNVAGYVFTPRNCR